MKRKPTSESTLVEIPIGDETLVIIASPRVHRGAHSEALTAAEIEILSLLLAGNSNTEIAKSRGTSVRTVANQIASIYRRFGVSGRAELTAYLCRADDGNAF